MVLKKLVKLHNFQKDKKMWVWRNGQKPIYKAVIISITAFLYDRKVLEDSYHIKYFIFFCSYQGTTKCGYQYVYNKKTYLYWLVEI